MQAWYNGKFVNWKEVTVSPLSHAFSRGMSIFEVIAIVDTSRGAAFLCLDEHLDRFFNSAELMHIKLPLSREELAGVVLESARVNQVRSGICKFNAYYPDVELTPLPSAETASLFVYSDSNENFGFNPLGCKTPKTMAVSRYKKLHQDSVHIAAKVTGNYVQAYLSACEMQQRGHDIPLFLDTEGYVCEGPVNNTFFVKDGKVITAGLNRVLAGTTRAALIDVARGLGIEVAERDIKAGELPGMEEVFICGSISQVTAIRNLDGRELGSRCPGEITAKIIAAMDALYAGEGDRAQRWLTWVG